MTRKLSIAIAAGLLLAGPAFADDQDTTRAKDQTQDQTRDQTQDQTQDKTSAGIGDQVKVLAKDQTKGDATNGIGEQVRELARFHGCEQSDSAECKAHHAVHGALADGAGAPTDRPALPGEASDRGATERNGAMGGAAEQAALRHAERAAAGTDTDDMHSNAHRAGHGDGHGMGDAMQGAETKRSGDAHPMGNGGTGGMNPGGGMR